MTIKGIPSVLSGVRSNLVKLEAATKLAIASVDVAGEGGHLNGEELKALEDNLDACVEFANVAQLAAHESVEAAAPAKKSKKK